MPTPEEIKSICTEYVDELFAYDDMSDQENIEAKNDAFVMCMAFAGHILDTHCIVPKRQMQMRHESCVALAETDPDRKDMYMCQKRVLETLFGTELFNEEKG